MDANAARVAMINGQVRTNDVADKAVQDALSAVPREVFAPRGKRSLAYADLDLPVGEGRWLLRPRDFAKLLAALDVKPTDLVLDVACARGYSTAVLAKLAETVIGLEDDFSRVERASESLTEMGVDNAAVIQGELAAGAPDQGPFDVIFVNGAVQTAPEAWSAQLNDGGRLGVIVREGGVGRACLYQRSGDVVGRRVLFESGAPLLPGFEKPASFAF